MIETPRTRQTADHFTGCLLGGAIGDALGGPTEFMDMAEIRRRYGPDGQQGFVQLNAQGLAAFTDDTQMTLFTGEGLLQGMAASRDPQDWISAVWQAYLRWLRTQSGGQPGAGDQGLLAESALWKRQAPGMTCLNALQAGQQGSPEHPLNTSKGCGGVMRVAPIGLLLTGKQAFTAGCQAAALTHGHPSGYLSAGVLAETVSWLAAGQSLQAAVQHALATLTGWTDHAETLHAVQRALSLAEDWQHRPTPETIETLGGGWVGEEALAIALVCALWGIRQSSFAEGVLLAVNHSGDNDSTAAIAGNLLGLLMGSSAIPSEWTARIELRAEIEQLALQLLRVSQTR